MTKTKARKKENWNEYEQLQRPRLGQDLRFLTFATQMSKTYTAAELSSLTELPRRTIRYWVGEGLVARPHGETKSARYFDSHLEELLAVKGYMEKGYRLGRIRDIMDARRKNDISDRTTPATNTIEVWTHVNVAPGIRLLIDPQAAKLAPEDTRRYAEAVAKAYQSIITDEEQG